MCPQVSLQEHLGARRLGLSVLLKGLNFRRIQGAKRTFEPRASDAFPTPNAGRKTNLLQNNPEIKHLR